MPDQEQATFEVQQPVPPTTAHTIFDSSLSLLPSGVRGMGRDHHLLFAGPNLDIHVKISEVDRHKEIYGQVIWRGQTQQSATVRLLTDKAAQEMELGPLGEFCFDEVPAGSASIEVLLPSDRVVAAFDA